MSTSPSYPPAPWHLAGDLVGTVLRMPPGALPPDLLPEHLPVTRKDGGVDLVAGWVDYRPGGLLAYREFLVAALLPGRLPLTGSILRIWVDSEASLAGGRELWDIPKRLAEFDFAGNHARILLAGKELAAFTYRERFRLPVRLPCPVDVVQETPGRHRRTRSSWRAELSVGRGRLTAAEDGELDFLNRGRVLAHLGLRDFRVTFGVRSEVTGA
ncbi:hypothetical protein JOF53_007407 [Crossiella equi]|uniref:Acetoacetate decarboxylase n=1 Tax=Crossiella equi TaxID=130796 RepID=A0ABS5APR2_9PSEU|nr:acetoacetate decarboxylase family protein [Crossiella equi]MBP2478535.1 hypothetical protein [Crossiella equi]